MRRFSFLRRDSTGALFQTEPARMCYDALCLEEIPHRHSYGVGDMTAEELLALDWRSWCQAFRDLQRQDRGFLTMCMMFRVLRGELKEDDERARDDRGRKVA